MAFSLLQNKVNEDKVSYSLAFHEDAGMRVNWRQCAFNRALHRGLLGATRLFGEHHRVETHLIPNVLKVALNQSAGCEVFGRNYPTPDGTCVRDYIHVEDLARAHLLALHPVKNGFFNLGSGAGYSFLEVIQTCKELSGLEIPYTVQPRRPGDPPRLVASAQKALLVLGWRPRYPRLEQIVGAAWRWRLALHLHRLFFRGKCRASLQGRQVRLINAGNGR